MSARVHSKCHPLDLESLEKLSKMTFTFLFGYSMAVESVPVMAYGCLDVALNVNAFMVLPSMIMEMVQSVQNLLQIGSLECLSDPGISLEQVHASVGIISQGYGISPKGSFVSIVWKWKWYIVLVSSSGT